MSEQKNPENHMESPFRKLVTGNLSLQVMVTIMAALLYAVLVNYLEEWVAGAITSAVFIPAYVAMIYTFMWGVAERERNLVLFGHMQEDKKRGLRSGLFAVIPLALFSLIAIVFAYMGEGANVIGLYRIFTAPFIFFVNPFIEYAPAALILTAVFSPLAAWLGYRNGSALYSIWSHLIYQNGVKPKRGEKRQKGPRTRGR